jgi:hypothetical protein
MSNELLIGNIEEIAEQGETILRSYIGDQARCIAQEWDNRIDCIMRLSDGSIVGEMVSLREATASRINEAGERLRRRNAGIQVALKNELRAPIRIVPKPK